MSYKTSPSATPSDNAESTPAANSAAPRLTNPSSASLASVPSRTGSPMSYHEHIAGLGSAGSSSLDYKAISRHLVSSEDTLKLQGGDIARQLAQQIPDRGELLERADRDHANSPGSTASISTHPRDTPAVSRDAPLNSRDSPRESFHWDSAALPKRRTRSSSFSTYLAETRRGSTASDINVPGGFRREFIIHKSIQANQPPPNFLTRNFMEFLSIYGHFAGEDLSDEEDGQYHSDSGENDSHYEEVFDEESQLRPGHNSQNYGSNLHHQSHNHSFQSLHGPGSASGSSPTPASTSALPKQLPKHRPALPPGTASVTKTFFLLFKSLVGSGVLFLPRAFYNGGLGFSIVALTLFGVLTFFCYIVLIKSKKTMHLSSYGELGFKTYGKTLKVFILISIVLSQFGFVATYILFAAENMTSFLSGILPDWALPYLNNANIVLLQFVFMIPLVLIRNLTKLSLVSLVSSVFIIVGLIIIFYYSGLNLIVNGVGPNITQFNPNSWSMLIGVAVTSFEGIGLILPIEASMAQPEKFPLVLSVGMAVITALFVAVGTLGYSSYGDQIKSIIILNLPQDSFAVRSILVLYSLAVFLTAPLQLFPAVKILESLAFNPAVRNGKVSKTKADNEGKLYQHSGKYNPQVKWLKNLFRSFIVGVVCIVAYANSSHIDKFVSFNGCFACIPLVYIYPPLIHLRTLKFQNSLTRLDHYLRAFDYVLFVVGIVAVVYTTYQIVFLN